MKAKRREDYWFSSSYKHQSTSCATLSILSSLTFIITLCTGAYSGEGGGMGTEPPPPERFKIMVFSGGISPNGKIPVYVPGWK